MSLLPGLDAFTGEWSEGWRQRLEAREPEDGHERVHREAPRQEEQDEPHPAGPETR
jgi:hypothetical protein